MDVAICTGWHRLCDQILKSQSTESTLTMLEQDTIFPHYPSFAEIGTWNAMPSEGQMDVDRELFYPLTSHDATDVQDVPKWTSQSADVIESDPNFQCLEESIKRICAYNATNFHNRQLILRHSKCPSWTTNGDHHSSTKASQSFQSCSAAYGCSKSNSFTFGYLWATFCFFPLDEHPLLNHPNFRVDLLFMFCSSRIAQGHFSTQQNTPFVPAPASEPTTPKQTRWTFPFKSFSPEDDIIWLSPQNKWYHIPIFCPDLQIFFSIHTASVPSLFPNSP